jgi:hypothetical protein
MSTHSISALPQGTVKDRKSPFVTVRDRKGPFESVRGR